ncbi:hypothetical protein EIP91_007668 [Steccherinum ochraceum]|uniref:AB hydrolase-1 domain-containing protein n=1 Tax=Steccherinum ochraceum TaxID=92696 RepID=A0A4R0RC67_9APHY|nr:hypothetical protein EIP91_007668 [Steccherinum ochraceum]
MPLAPVDTHGTQLHYEDSGAPLEVVTYTTLVLLHGVYFNSGIFRPLIPYAAENGLRLVLLNGRDNGESTSFTDDELKSLAVTSREEREAFLKRRVHEYASFLRWYVENEDTPLLEEANGNRTGGVSLVMWSGGNGYGPAFFAYADTFPAHTRQVLQKYLRSYVIYDAPMYPLGLPHPPQDELYSPTRDPTWTRERLQAAFLPGLVGHYSNDTPLFYRAFNATSFTDLPSRREFCTALKWQPDSEPAETDPSQFDGITEAAALHRSAVPILVLGEEICSENTKKMLSDRKNFPKVTLECVVASRGMSETIYGMYGLKRMLLERDLEEKDGEVREARFHILEGANHMWHWLKPKETAALFAKIA